MCVCVRVHDFTVVVVVKILGRLALAQGPLSCPATNLVPRRIPRVALYAGGSVLF